MTARFLFSLCVFCVLCGESCRAADFDKEQLEKIDDAVAASLKRGDCPGVVVLVVHADEVVFRKALRRPCHQAR